MADNVDHNIRTLDGCNTFHGMGIIATYTPGKPAHKTVPRMSVTSDEIKRVGRINIRYFKSQHTGDLPLTFKELTAMEKLDPTADVDLLWDISLVLYSRRPAWSGLMQSIHQGAHPGRSSVLFLPMIDLDPNNMTCIFSTLNYVCDQAKVYNVTPVVTFDQPLFWKALLIIESEPSWSVLKTVVLRLGGLHMEMSFLGCVGHFMAATGLAQVLEMVYAENAVKHILTGKAIARAVRGHFMVHAALSTMLIANAYNIPLPTIPDEASTADESEDRQDVRCDMQNNVADADDDATHQSLQRARELFNDTLMNPSASVSLDLSSEDALHVVIERLNAGKDSMKDLRTAKLWIQYMEMIGILRTFIKAERTGDWKLHLQAVHDMLPYFAAAGHNLYAKSAYIYVQKM